jgi:hypothetical protein
MEINIPTKHDDRYYMLLTFLSAIKPFSFLRKRELQVYAELIKYWHEYKDLTPKQRNKLIFDYDTRLQIAEKYKTSVDNIYNITSALKKKGLITDNAIIEKYANLLSLENSYLKINFVYG